VKTKLVKRYECDFCGRRKYSVGSMKVHESSCTKNPDRKCRVCDLLDNAQTPTEDLLKTLPDPGDLFTQEWEPGRGLDQNEFRERLLKALPGLRDAANDCPACIMAGLRLKGIPVPIAKPDFEFKKEMDDVFADVNERRTSWM